MSCEQLNDEFYAQKQLWMTEIVSHLIIGDVEIGLEVSGHDDEPVEDGEADQRQPHGLEALPRHQGLLHSLIEVPGGDFVITVDVKDTLIATTKRN